jgi:hypothetical protein
VFEKDLVFHCRHESAKIACNRPDAWATPSERGLNMETREVRYEKVIAQFTVRTPAREIRISGDLGL